MATKFNTVNPHDEDDIFAFAQHFELDSFPILVPSSPKKEAPLLYYWMEWSNILWCDLINIFAFAECFELDSLSILVPSSPKKEVQLLYYWHNSSIFSLDEWNEATYYDAISLTSLPLHNALN